MKTIRQGRIDAVMLEKGAQVWLTYRKLSTGELIEMQGWTCISIDNEAGTFTLKNPVNNQIRTLKRLLITQINGAEVIF